MKFVSTLCAVMVISLGCFRMTAQDNPFTQMADKPYAEYAQEWYGHYEEFLKLDTVECRKVVRQIEEVARQTGSTEWKMYVDYFELILTKIKNNYPAVYSEKMLQQEFELLDKARKAGVVQIEFKIRDEILANYYRFRNYELSLEQCNIQADRLQDVSSGDVPEKSRYLIQAGNLYYDFRDYAKAISLYEQALSEPETGYNQWYRLGALNNLGLCYRYGLDDLDRSDSCFHIILQTKYFLSRDEENRDDWDGIAEGNIGRNMVMRGEYGQAIPLLKSSLEKVLKSGDYGFASGPSNMLAAVYLAQGNTAEAKRYIDIALDYYSRWPRESVLPLIYETMSKYYAMTGNTLLSIAYMDSTLAENKRQAEEFNAIQIVRVEQRRHISVQALKDAQLHTETIQKAGYRRSLIIAVISLFLLGGVLFRYLVLYRKKKAAYGELVRKLQEWAQVDTLTDKTLNESDQTETDEQDMKDFILEESDLLLMKETERLMTEDKLYKNNALTIDMIAQRLGCKKNQLSKVINSHTKNNFNFFVSEYRIKEAIRMLSLDDKTLSIKVVAYMVGYNNRNSFNVAFRKMTGMSPTDYRANLQKK